MVHVLLQPVKSVYYAYVRLDIVLDSVVNNTFLMFFGDVGALLILTSLIL